MIIIFVLFHCFVSPVSCGNLAIFSHADPCAYLVSALCGIDPAITAPVTPCSVFRLERTPGEDLFRLTVNGSISHLSALGRTEPSHPVHFYHDWCALFKEMRTNGVVPKTFRWPPSNSEELQTLKNCWEERYSRLLVEGPSSTIPFIGPPRSQRKICFRCVHCNAVSYLKQKLYFKSPPCHVISCWGCSRTFCVEEITIIEDPFVANQA